MALVVIFLLLLFLVLSVYFYLNTLRFSDFEKKVGGPRGLPIVGVFHRLISMRDVLYILPKLTGKTKSAFFWLTILKPTFYTYDPEHIEKILTSPTCINRSELYDVIDTEIGSGIMTSKSPLWEKNRKIMNSCFSQKILRSFFPIFNQESDNLIRKLDELVGSGENDMRILLQTFVLQTSFATSGGRDLSRSVSQDKEFISHVERFLHTVFERSIVPLMRFEVTFQFCKIYKAYEESKKIVHNFIEEFLKKKYAELDNKTDRIVSNNSITTNESLAYVEPENTFIDLIINSHGKNLFSIQDVYNETHVMIATAFETSATTLNNILMFIAMHPEYQEKLYEEIVSVFPKKDFDVDFEHLSDLVYMDMFINECLRVAPSVPLISRRVSKKTNIGDDLWIPHGTILIIDIFNLHRCKEIWGPNAEKFDPDNFLRKNQDGRHAYSYIPFSKGQRNCIGWRYARMFLKIALSKIIGNYRFSTSFLYDDLRCVQHLTLRYEVVPKLEIQRR